jgi:hypothetical protein
VNLVEPGTIYGDRANQLDMRFSKISGARRRANLNLDLTMSEFEPDHAGERQRAWRMPQRHGRALFKLSAC